MTVDAAADEKELVRKLVFTGHLSVPERKALPGGTAKASLIRSAIEEALRSGRSFRAWWLPDDSMIGSEIEYRGESPSWVGWSYSGIEGERAGAQGYGSTPEAVEALVRALRQFLGDKIDGVVIDWTA